MSCSITLHAHGSETGCRQLSALGQHFAFSHQWPWRRRLLRAGAWRGFHRSQCHVTAPTSAVLVTSDGAYFVLASVKRDLLEGHWTSHIGKCTVQLGWPAADPAKPLGSQEPLLLFESHVFTSAYTSYFFKRLAPSAPIILD